MRGRRASPAIAAALLMWAATPAAQAGRFDLAEATIADIAAATDAGALDAETLMSLYLARIEAYEARGPQINAIVSLNSDAMAQARALDLERAQKGRRSLLHGIPVVLKDNIDSVGLPNTGGSIFLAGNMPVRDAHIVKGLRDAGAIILAKVNLGDFASDATGRSSIGGQTRNPHDPAYTLAGSSGGTGAAVGAWFAPLGLATDTGGSLRSPTSVNGLVGLKPTTGLLSRGGNIPTCLAFDSPGPMARSVHDVALSLGFMTGMDPADPMTRTGAGLFHRDYTQFLDTDALRGARIGIVRDVSGVDAEIDAVFEAAVADLRRLGAVLVDPVSFPPHLMGARAGLTKVVCDTEVPLEFARYLETIGPVYPKSIGALAQRADEYLSRHPEQAADFPKIYAQYKKRTGAMPGVDSLTYRSARDHGLAMARDAVLGLFETDRLDALVYVTRANRPELVGPAQPARQGASDQSLRNIANLTGFPDLIVPAGKTGDGLPVSISFFGPAYSEPRLLAFGYAYEQATRKRFNAAATPRLDGEVFDYEQAMP